MPAPKSVMLIASVLLVIAALANPTASARYSCRFKKSEGVTGVRTRGTFSIEDIDDGMMKATVNLKNIKGMINAHIHLGAEGVSGPPVVFAFEGAIPAFSGDFKYVFDFNASLLDMETLENAGYYYNVHTKKYPAGEVRCNMMA